MDAVKRLEAIEDIKQLKARYFLYLDTKNFEAWRTVFADDAVMDVSGQFPEIEDPEPFIFRGVEQIVATVPVHLDGIATAHHGHMPLISIEADDAACGIWAMEDNLILSDGSRMLGYGHYHERYRKIAGDWRITFTALKRIKVLVLPAPTE